MFVNLQFEKCNPIVILFPLLPVVLSSYSFCISICISVNNLFRFSANFPIVICLWVCVS